MAFERGPVIQRAGTAARADIDEGLRAFMLKIYNYMCLALGVTGAVAMFTASSDTMMQAIFGTPLAYVVMFSPLAFILVLSFGINKLGTGAVQAIFWAFAATMGLSMASIFMVYTDTSIAKVFFITASVFAAMSLYGYTTKRSLAAMGAFMFMGDLAREIALPVEIDFMAVSSYGNTTKTSGVVRIVKDLDLDLSGRDVLIVEDIVHSGLTLRYLSRNLLARNPASLEVCALLVREGKSANAPDLRYVGFTIPPAFVVGYGLDVAERYRNLPYVCAYIGDR